MCCSPWVPEQVMVSPLMIVEPEQVQVRDSRSGMFSSAAASVTVLYTEPGVNAADRKRFRYAPL